MIRAACLSLAFATLLACSRAAPGAADAAADESAGQTSAAAPAGADEAVAAWYREQYGVQLIEPVSTFYGDFSGDGAADVLAFGYFDMGGSGAGLTIALFRNDGGRMSFVRTVDDVFGMEPRDVTIAPGRITLTTTMPRAGDPHCCPTGSQEWTIEAN